jgi:hypothetical protein
VSLLIFALIVLLVVAVCVYGLRMVSPDANLTNIGTLILIIIGVVVIARHAGMF